MVALRQGFFQPLEHIFYFYHRTNFQKTTQDDHIQRLGRVVSISILCCVNSVHIDIGTRWKFLESIAVENQGSARFYLTFELIE